MKQIFFIVALVAVSIGVSAVFMISRQENVSDGSVSVAEDVNNELVKIDLIRVSNPLPNQIIASPLVVEGEARGTWFFEASFPVLLFDANGSEITYAIAQAQAEWMTEEFVPFHAKLEFTKPATAEGTLIFEKDNPSGLPEHGGSFAVPVRFQ